MVSSTMIRAAVLGKPISHSLSPIVHGLIYEALGIQYQYERYELDVGTAPHFIRNAFDHVEEGWTGFSLTMPLKEIGFDMSREVDPIAIRSHSINTITREGCFNTDVTGLQRVLRMQNVVSDEVIILGNGATARAVLIAIESMANLSRVTVYRRSESRDVLLTGASRYPLVIKDLSELGRRHLGSEVLLVSTLPSIAQLEVSSHLLGFEGTLLDISYAPWPSVLAGVVEGSVISGLPVLVAQAIDQARIFTAMDFDEDELYRSVLISTIQRITAR